MRSTQNQVVMAHLRTRGKLTPVQAMTNYGIMRLAARVEELRRLGWDIETEMVSVDNGDLGRCRYASYTLIGH